MTLILPNTFVNDTVASATPVEQNYTFIEQYINAELIHRDGGVEMNAPLTVVSPPTAPTHAASKSYVDSMVPIGCMLPYGGVDPPSPATWALCNGASLSTTVYSDLFGVIQYRFGGSGGSMTLPNMQGKMMLGVWPDNEDLTVNDADCNLVGETGGSTVPPLKTHTHPIDHDHLAVTSSGENVNHTHVMNHDHASDVTSTNSVGADVTIPARANPTAFGSGSLARSNNSGTASNMEITTVGGSHAHNADLPLYSGSTSGPNVNHTHGVDLDPYTGASLSPVQTVDTKYRPPYVTVSFIIRIA